MVEKVVTEQLLQFCKANKKLYKRQIEARKHQSTIDVAVFIASSKFFDWDIDDDLIGWTLIFLTNRWVELVTNGYINPSYKIETKIPQRLPVSSVLFMIYISEVFLEMRSHLS